ncbi:polyhydroxybutyrate depolymerase [Roseovarius sp. CAU 1744]|uniref:alpha/beta hydrolase family esterase n=1 Tax=Roseovarius sp. CAU 1744 TaxID=3140368 RepID=UPI00325A49C5
MRFLWLFVALSLSGIGVRPALACGQDSDCVIGDRHYRIYMPAREPADERVGAIVFAHGFGGSAKGTLRNQSLLQIADDLGVAIVAVQSAAKDWSIPGAPSEVTLDDVDELAYFDAAIKDMTTRFPIDPNRLVASGFSAGGMMVWNLACYRSHQFAAFIPIAGTFWRGAPSDCATPPKSIVHIHGDDDKIVPLKGRKVMDTHQGDVAQTLEMYARFGAFDVATDSIEGDLKCRNRRNSDGLLLSFCQFSGGHSFKAQHLRSAWQMLQKTGTL